MLAFPERAPVHLYLPLLTLHPSIIPLTLGAPPLPPWTLGLIWFYGWSGALSSGTLFALTWWQWSFMERGRGIVRYLMHDAVCENGDGPGLCASWWPVFDSKIMCWDSRTGLILAGLQS